MAKEKKRRRKRNPGSGPPGNLNPSRGKAGAWAVLSMMRGTRAITREVAESMAKTVAGILSDLGASDLADLSTSKRLLLESVAGQVEMRRAWERDILGHPSRELVLDSLHRAIGSGHYLALCNTLRTNLDKLGAWERVPREIEAESRLYDIQRRYLKQGPERENEILSERPGSGLGNRGQ